jgi:hypothetical protein
MHQTTDIIRFDYGTLRCSVTDPREHWQLLLRIAAEFSISVDGRLFYREAEFPIVEFASQAARWLRAGSGDFLYSSMESEEEPLIGFYEEDNDQFRLYSPHQESDETLRVSGDALRDSIASLIVTVANKARAKLSLDITQALGNVDCLGIPGQSKLPGPAP